MSEIIKKENKKITKVGETVLTVTPESFTFEADGINFNSNAGGIAMVGEESQLDRIEKKADRILELLEGKESSTSYDSIEIGKLSDLPDDVLKRNKLGKYAKN